MRADADHVREGGAGDGIGDAKGLILIREPPAAGFGSDDFFAINDEHRLSSVLQRPRALQSCGSHADDHDVETVGHMIHHIAQTFIHASGKFMPDGHSFILIALLSIFFVDI